MKKGILNYFQVFIGFTLMFSACSYFPARTPDQPSAPFMAGQILKPTLPILSTATPAELFKITYQDPIPVELSEQIDLAEKKGQLQAFTPSSVGYQSEGQLLSNWIYVVAAGFPSLIDDIKQEELLALWQGNPRNEIWTKIYFQETDRDVLTLKFGEPAKSFVEGILPEEALAKAWLEPQALFILPFEKIGPRWKVLKFGGASIFSRSFDVKSYPLAFQYALTADSKVEIDPAFALPITNYDQSKMTTVLLTGVTALVRATGAKMESEGINFPASSIEKLLLDADLTHISNEVSFARDCPSANAAQESVMFCSRPEYFDLFTFADIDVVELSGNHLKDWSNESFDYSLQLYEDAGMGVYAGGTNQVNAREPYKVELNGNKIAFVGCNPAGPESVWATDSMSGVADCKDDWLVKEVEALVKEGYLPIVTMQHFETYAMEPNIYQKTDFLNLSANGAVIVSGSQAHLPQGMTFIGDHFIHYGLGNLFFDQMDIPVVGTRREFLDRHVFYEGKYIQTELYTTMLEDYARPRLMTEDERKDFLRDIFIASKWMDKEE